MTRAPVRTIALGLLLAAGACGVGSTQRAADRVMAAADRTQSAPVLTAALHAELRPVDAATPASGAAVLSPADQPVPADLDAMIEARGLATLRREGTDVALFDRARTLLRRPEATADDARPWLELHLADVRAGSTAFDPAGFKAGAAYALVSVLDPRLLLDLAASPLSGSVRALGADRYRANFDVDKALDDRRRRNYTADHRERVRRVLDVLSLDRPVNPGELWLEGGRLKRVQLELQVKPSRYAVWTLAVTIEIGGGGGRAGAPITVPDRRQTVIVESLSALQRSAAGLAGSARA